MNGVLEYPFKGDSGASYIYIYIYLSLSLSIYVCIHVYLYIYTYMEELDIRLILGYVEAM